MSEFENPPLTLDMEETFKKYLPKAEITSIQPKDVPENVMGVFEWASKRFIYSRDYRPLNFIALYMIAYEGGGKSFISKQLKWWYTQSSGRPHRHIEHNVQLIDVDTENNILGRSELVRVYPKRNGFFKDKPYEMWSGTEEGYRRTGLSLRRTITLNALSQMIWNLPLYSDEQFIRDKDDSNNTIQPQKLVWEKLVRLGLAKKIEIGRRRFVFNK